MWALGLCSIVLLAPSLALAAQLPPSPASAAAPHRLSRRTPAPISDFEPDMALMREHGLATGQDVHQNEFSHRMLTDPDARERQQQHLSEVSRQSGTRAVDREAARAVLRVLRARRNPELKYAVRAHYRRLLRHDPSVRAFHENLLYHVRDPPPAAVRGTPALPSRENLAEWRQHAHGEMVLAMPSRENLEEWRHHATGETVWVRPDQPPSPPASAASSPRLARRAAAPPSVFEPDLALMREHHYANDRGVRREEYPHAAPNADEELRIMREQLHDPDTPAWLRRVIRLSMPMQRAQHTPNHKYAVRAHYRRVLAGDKDAGMRAQFEMQAYHVPKPAHARVRGTPALPSRENLEEWRQHADQETGWVGRPAPESGPRLTRRAAAPPSVFEPDLALMRAQGQAGTDMDELWRQINPKAYDARQEALRRAGRADDAPEGLRRAVQDREPLRRAQRNPRLKYAVREHYRRVLGKPDDDKWRARRENGLHHVADPTHKAVHGIPAMPSRENQAEWKEHANEETGWVGRGRSGAGRSQTGS